MKKFLFIATLAIIATLSFSRASATNISVQRVNATGGVGPTTTALTLTISSIIFPTPSFTYTTNLTANFFPVSSVADATFTVTMEGKTSTLIHHVPTIVGQSETITSDELKFCDTKGYGYGVTLTCTGTNTYKITPTIFSCEIN